MHPVSKQTLKRFWERHPVAEKPLREWLRVVRKSAWRGFAELKAVYASADQVVKLVVFDIGGNKYRLTAKVEYAKGKVFVIFMDTHEEYDRRDLKNL